MRVQQEHSEIDTDTLNMHQQISQLQVQVHSSGITIQVSFDIWQGVIDAWNSIAGIFHLLQEWVGEPAFQVGVSWTEATRKRCTPQSTGGDSQRPPKVDLGTTECGGQWEPDGAGVHTGHARNGPHSDHHQWSSAEDQGVVAHHRMVGREQCLTRATN